MASGSDADAAVDMLCVHACCRLSLPIPLLAIQFCLVLPPWVILIVNLILIFTIVMRLLRMCVSQGLMELEQHLLLLCPTPPAVSPM